MSFHPRGASFQLVIQIRTSAAICLILFASLHPCLAAPRRFQFPADTFAFSNDTVFVYGTDELGTLTVARRDKEPEFTHRCFVLARATIQFFKFARFDASLPKASDDDYRKMVRHVSRIPTWFSQRELSDRVIVPGYPNLYQFTKGRQGMLKQELGNWLPTYFRWGNQRIMMPIPRGGQERLADWLIGRIDEGRPSAVFLVRFPYMNHVVLPHAYQREPNGDLDFTVYDPNSPGEDIALRYRAAERSFDLQKRWYFPHGGRVNALRVYLSPFH